MARLGWRGGGMIDRETSRSSNQGLGVAKGWKWTDLGCRGLTKHGGIRPYRSRMRLSIFSMNMGQFGWHYMDVVIALGNKGWANGKVSRQRPIQICQDTGGIEPESWEILISVDLHFLNSRTARKHCQKSKPKVPGCGTIWEVVVNQWQAKQLRKECISEGVPLDEHIPKCRGSGSVSY